MDQKQFILNTLLPYKEDKAKCAIQDTKSQKNLCVYLTKDNRKCAVGQHLKKGNHQTHVGDVFSLNTKFTLSNILTEEAKAMNFSIWIWKHIQQYHDALAIGDNESVALALNQLEKTLNIKLEELYLTKN